MQQMFSLRTPANNNDTRRETFLEFLRNYASPVASNALPETAYEESSNNLPSIRDRLTRMRRQFIRQTDEDSSPFAEEDNYDDDEDDEEHDEDDQDQEEMTDIQIEEFDEEDFHTNHNATRTMSITESDDEEDDMVNNSLVKESFGPFGLEVFKRLIRAGIVEQSNYQTNGNILQRIRFLRRRQAAAAHTNTNNTNATSEMEQELAFMRSILRYFVVQSKISKQKAKEFIDCLPSLERLSAVCDASYLKSTNIKPREILVVKMVIEIHENFLAMHEYPLYTDLRKQLLPIAIKFYSNINSSILKSVCQELNLILTSLQDVLQDSTIKFHHFTSNEQQSFVSYYKDRLRKLDLLCMGNSESLFIS